jgi:hypothetical protein
MDRLPDPIWWSSHRDHAAIVLDEYADAILEGRKTVEARLTKQCRAPYGRLWVGDRLFFKRRGGDYCAQATIAGIAFFSNLTPARVRRLRERYNDAILGSPAFWRLKRHAKYATLIWFDDVGPAIDVPAFRWRPREAWSTLCHAPAELTASR